MNRYAAIQEIQRLAKDVAVGEDRRFVCPNCGTGSGGQGALSIRRVSPVEATFCCYRAECFVGKGYIGTYSDGEKVLTARSNAYTKVPPNFETYPLSEEGANLLRNKYSLDDILIRYSRIRHLFDRRFYIPIFDTLGRERGAVLRKEKQIYSGKREYSTVPKKWLLKKQDGPTMGWYRKDRHTDKNSKTVVIVEDALSALRCVPYCDAVYLNGIQLPVEAQREIKTEGYLDVVIALDNDAMERSFKLADAVRPYLPHTRVMPLPKDIKNMDKLEWHEMALEWIA